MTDDVITRLRAALDAAERQARATDQLEPWRVTGEEMVMEGGVLIATGRWGGSPAAEHIAAWDPARVLRLIARDRELIDRHACYEGRCHWCICWCDCENQAACDHGKENVPFPCPDVRDAAAFWLDGDTEEEGES